VWLWMVVAPDRLSTVARRLVTSKQHDLNAH